MKKLEKKNDIKILLLIICSFILTLIMYFFSMDFNRNSKISTVDNSGEIKASEVGVPAGFIEIWTAEDLAKITEDPDNLYEDYILMDNIDLAGKDFTIIGKEKDKPYKGTFDGNGKTISNLTIDNSEDSCIGMFGYINGGTVKNLILENINVDTKKGMYVGGLAGHIANNANIENISIKTTNIKIKQDPTSYQCFIGSIIGYADSSTIKQCSTFGKIEYKEIYNRAAILGGAIGYLVDTTTIVENISSEVDLIYDLSSGSLKIGGLIGGIYNTNNTKTTISKCHSIGKITVFSMASTIQMNSRAIIPNAWKIGGLIGEGTDKLTISECYSKVDIDVNADSTNKCIGGLLGDGFKGVEKCYAIGNINVVDTGNGSINYIGGLTSTLSIDSVKNSYSIVNIDANIDLAEAYVNGIAGTNTYIAGKINLMSKNPKSKILMSRGNGSYWASYMLDDESRNKIEIKLDNNEQWTENKRRTIYRKHVI